MKKITEKQKTKSNLLPQETAFRAAVYTHKKEHISDDRLLLKRSSFPKNMISVGK